MGVLATCHPCAIHVPPMCHPCATHVPPVCHPCTCSSIAVRLLGQAYELCARRAQAHNKKRKYDALSRLQLPDGRSPMFTKASRAAIPEALIERIRCVGMGVRCSPSCTHHVPSTAGCAIICSSSGAVLLASHIAQARDRCTRCTVAGPRPALYQ